jgi:hypothetical protein
VCYDLRIASPLTLSEVRSMLPDGLSADLLPPADAAILLALHPPARTAARLVSGSCSCDLFLERRGGIRGEEAELRREYRGLGVSRDGVIRALERHRRPGRVRHLPDRWAALIVAFVAEHARNAGPTLFLRQLSADGTLTVPDQAAVTVPLREVRMHPASWLADGRPTLVIRDG